MIKAYTTSNRSVYVYGNYFFSVFIYLLSDAKSRQFLKINRDEWFSIIGEHFDKIYSTDCDICEFF